MTSSFDGTLKIWDGDDFHLEFSSQPLETAYNDVVEILNHGLEKSLMMIAASNRDKTIKLFIKKDNESWNVLFSFILIIPSFLRNSHK